jgi:hypothetical protein
MSDNPIITEDDDELVTDVPETLIYEAESTCLVPTAALNKHCVCPPRITVNPPPAVLVYNAAQTVTLTCPEGFSGEVISITVPAGTYSAEVGEGDTVEGKQAEVNATALADAQAQADAQRLTEPCVSLTPEEVPVTIIDCQYRTATAALVGCNEFGTPSSPPLYYRRLELTGSVVTRYWDGDGCGPEDGSDPNSYTVSCTNNKFLQHDPFTGTITTGGTTVCEGPTGTSTDENPISCDVSTAATCDTVRTVQSTTVIIRESSGACCTQFSLFYKEMSDTLTWTLSDVDTEQDAIDRSEFTEWTGEACESSSAYYEERTGREFDIKQLQFKALLGSIEIPLLVGYTYEIQFSFSRRIYGTSDSFLPFATGTLEILAASSTQTSDWIDVPNEVGFETKITAVEIISISS